VAQRESVQPHGLLERRELLRVLADEIAHLPQRERRVVELYYREELTMKEIGAVLGVTESRVCQLHSQAAGRLGAAIRARLHPTLPAAASGGRRRGTR
jgi:RNA polymerase sigma factor for flagellar operon FliA